MTYLTWRFNQLGTHWAALLLAAVCTGALAQRLPPEVDAALQRAQVPRDAVSLVVLPADGVGPARLNHRGSVPVNPASVMKLVTTFAALDLLGPAYTWRTAVFVEGAVREGTLYGNLHIRGEGDPKLVTERLWLLLRRVQGLGINRIAGDIVLDRRAFDVPPRDPGAFDGEPLRPYNASPDALLINFKSVVMTFVPDPLNGVARVNYEPPLAGVQVAPTVPLSPPGRSNADCGDYRSTLQADFSQASRIHFAGSYPASCGERVWPVAYTDPASFAARAIEGLWREMGGQLGGQVREGSLPGQPSPVLVVNSPTLAEVIRDINKFSNNVMAQQVFLTLSQQSGTGVGSVGASRERLQSWWRTRVGGEDAPLLDNGSGLSRDERISAAALARMLQTAWRAGTMPELMSSLPITGIDGTLRRSKASPGAAHLKTGSLRDVSALAGYVLSASGKRYVLVAIVNHPNAANARPALEALVDWAIREGG